MSKDTFTKHPVVSSPSLGGAGRRGFALLITVTLLAFLVLLLVSLASLTRVETQVASNNQQLAQARQNALLALNIALGQLQKYAGPDQRVTATADLATGSATGVRITTGLSVNGTVGIKKYWDTTGTSNGLSRVQPGTRYWTGVWGNLDPSAPTAGNGNLYEKTPRPVLLNWLVSGNEGATFTSSTAAGNFGQVTTVASGVAKTPATAASPAISTATQATDLLTLGTGNAVLLVGANTAGTQSRTVETNYTETATDRYVVAPLVPIQVDSSSVPGLGGSGPTTVGRYAWWVGDEGVKARLNLADRYATATTPSADPLARARLMTAPRSGAEVVADTSSSGALADFANVASAYANWSQSGATANKALSLPQLGMLDTTNTLSPAALGRHFNDFTTYSAGIEADSYNGGLRKDLTYYLEQGVLPTWTGTDGQSKGKDLGILPAAYSPAMQTLATADKRVPRWDIIHSFYNLPTGTDDSGNTNKLTGSSSSDIIYVRPATATRMGISPMVVQLRIMGGVTGNSTATATTTTTEVPSIPPNTRRQLANVMIVLANPYPVTMSAPNGIAVQFNNDWRINDSNKIKLRDVTNGADVGWVADVLGGGTGRVTLQIPAFTLAKGEAAAFYISGQHQIINGSAATMPLVQLGSSFPNAGGSSFKDYVYCDYGGWNTSSSSTSVNVRQYEIGGNATMIAEFTVPGSSQLLMQVGGINLNRSVNDYHQINFNPQAATPANYAVFNFACYYNEAGDTYPYGGGSSGMGDTALRSWMDFNPRAGYYRVTNYAYVGAPYIQYYTPKGNELNDFSTGLATVYWGRSVGTLSSMASATVDKSILFDLPRKTAGSGDEFAVMSLAALQHANLGAEDIPTSASSTAAAGGFNDYTWEYGSASVVPPNPGHQPGYAFGNSYASIFLPRDKTVFTPDSTNYPWQMDNWGSNLNGGESNGKGRGGNAQVARRYYDISYLLNASLWDGCFLSTIPQDVSVSNYKPVNPRLELRDDMATGAAVVRDGDRAAKYVKVSGAFNINSTSVDAWSAVLSGMKNLPKIPGLDSGGTNGATVFPRSLWQSADAASPPTGTGADSYSGYRQLSDADIGKLAVEIVKQVRMRGPFVSLSQFVNRTLVSATNDQTYGLGQSGGLQRAIDNAGLNQFSDPAASTANDKAEIPTGGESAALAEAGDRGTYSFYADTTNAGVPNQLNRSTGIPGWLTQADVLQAIGPVISARSDTFVIRTYGDVQNPVTASTTARAWCEAVVQRMPDYVDSSANSAEVAPVSASATNQTFGRRFKVVSFRWLSPGDI